MICLVQFMDASTVKLLQTNRRALRVHTFVQVEEQILIEMSMFGQHEQEGETEEQLHCFILHIAGLRVTARNQS